MSMFIENWFLDIQTKRRVNRIFDYRKGLTNRVQHRRVKCSGTRRLVDLYIYRRFGYAYFFHFHVRRTLHTDFNIPYVTDVIHKRINKHHNKLEAHPNPLLEPPLQPINTRRLQRSWPLDLQNTWGDVAVWIPYNVTIIHGIVAYFV